MKKKIHVPTIQHVIYMNIILVISLWALSIILTVMLLNLFGWKVNRSYSKQKEYRYKKKIDIVCKTIVVIWCWMAIVNIISFGPLFVFYQVLKNSFYIIFTVLLIMIWLKRSYRKQKSARNFIVIFSIWNMLMYFIFGIHLLSMLVRSIQR